MDLFGRIMEKNISESQILEVIHIYFKKNLLTN